MIPNTFRSFIHDIAHATDQGDVLWSEGDFAAYYCARGESTVHLSQHMDHDAERAYIRLSFSAAGRVTPFTVTEGQADYPVMSALYESVVANANNVGDDLKRFLAS